MRKLTEQELDQKIGRFLDSRFTAHPELKKVPNVEVKSETVGFVSRVKNISQKFFHVQTPTLYQGQ